MRTLNSRASLRASGGARTVLLAMAASEDRAARISDLKESRPDLTWDRIGTYCGVKERSAIEWSRTGGITFDNCRKLAELFEVDHEWLWSGRARQDKAPDVLDTLDGQADLKALTERIKRLEEREANREALITLLLDRVNQPDDPPT